MPGREYVVTLQGSPSARSQVCAGVGGLIYLRSTLKAKVGRHVEGVSSIDEDNTDCVSGWVVGLLGSWVGEYV